MLILIAQPRLAPRRLVAPIAQDGIERHEPESRQPRDHAPQARGAGARTRCRRRRRSSRRAARAAPDARTTRADRACGAGRRTSRRRRRRPASAGPLQIGLDELHALEPEAARGRRRRARATRASGRRRRSGDRRAPGRATSDRFRTRSRRSRASPGIARSSSRAKRAALGARAQRLQAVARRIAGKRRALVEAADGLGARVAGQPQIGNAVGASKRAPQPTHDQSAESAPAHAGQASSSRKSSTQKIA